MANGIYTSMSGAIAQERAMETVSHNLANAMTTGFKRQQDSFEAVRAKVGAQIANPDQAPGAYEPPLALPLELPQTSTD